MGLLRNILKGVDSCVGGMGEAGEEGRYHFDPCHWPFSELGLRNDG